MRVKQAEILKSQNTLLRNILGSMKFNELLTARNRIAVQETAEWKQEALKILDEFLTIKRENLG